MRGQPRLRPLGDLALVLMMGCSSAAGDDHGTATDGATGSNGHDDGNDANADAGSGSDEAGDGRGDGSVPPGDTCSGYATRYWDCCKPHCGWPHTVEETSPTASCNAANVSHGADWSVPSACEGPGPDAAYTCYSMAPWAVSDDLAYGFAAVPATGDVCGRCYQLEFTGQGHYSADDPGSSMLAGKTMIVQATNIGHDVAGGQFDLLIPGGGVGLFDACSAQWDVDTAELGATYGGFLTACQEQLGHDDLTALTQCVLDRCDAVFDEPGHQDLARGCTWFTTWYGLADNPNLDYAEVPCPQALVDVSGIDRRPLDDVQSCDAPGPACSSEEQDACDCAWTDGGQNCGDDDGSCCWIACCG